MPAARGSGSDSIPSSHAKLRDADAVARWPRLMIQPSASSGQTSCSSSVMKSVNSPIVRLPAITSRPPKRSTAAIESVGRKSRPGQEARLDARLAQRRRRAPPRPGPAKRVAHVVLAAERLHHLDPDDGLVGRLGDVALLRAAPRARSARRGARRRTSRTAIGGIATARRTAPAARSRATSTIAAPIDHHHALDRLHDAPADEVADRVEVVRRARDDLAGRVPVVEGARDSGGTPRRASRASAPRRGSRSARSRSGA